MRCGAKWFPGNVDGIRAFADKPCALIRFGHRIHLDPTLSASPNLAKPNYSFAKRQRELDSKKQQEEKQAKKKEARESAKASDVTASDDMPATPGDDGN